MVFSRLKIATRLLAGAGLVSVALLAFSSPKAPAADPAAKEALVLTAGQKDFLNQEPILVSLRCLGARVPALPPGPSQGKAATLRFEIEPAVKPRLGAKALPLETLTAVEVRARHYDLSEWFLFPQTGTWTVRAVLQHNGRDLASQPIAIAIRQPAKGDAEVNAVGRIHHTPWSNYGTNAFCGDTGDVVQKWPQSRLSKYCHYWNGRFFQHKKEYDKALASYRLAANSPGFALADHAEFGVVQCLVAQGKIAEAGKVNRALCAKLPQTTAVGSLAGALSRRLMTVSGVEEPARAEDKGKNPSEAGYTSLFNGKDLTGWKYSNKSMDGQTATPDGRIEVKDGAIVMNEKDAKGKGGIRDLYTARPFNKDFHLKLEFRGSLKSDSGVYLRGPQLQVRDFIRRKEQKQLTKFKNDDWNELDITVKGGNRVTRINGRTLNDKDVLELTVKDGKPQAKLNGKDIDVNNVQVTVSALATCLCNGEPLAPKTMAIPEKSNAGIGLQAETGKFEFRNLRIKEAE